MEKIVAAVTQDDVPQHPDFVRIMSLHKSKGLTSPSVFIVGAVQGIIPTLPSGNDREAEAATEEQRRLFYVAITRASEQLTISHAVRIDLATAYRFGVFVDKRRVRKEGDQLICRMIASSYLPELGPDAPAAVRGIDWIKSY